MGPERAAVTDTSEEHRNTTSGRGRAQVTKVELPFCSVPFHSVPFRSVPVSRPEATGTHYSVRPFPSAVSRQKYNYKLLEFLCIMRVNESHRKLDDFFQRDEACMSTSRDLTCAMWTGAGRICAAHLSLPMADEEKSTY